MLYLGIDQHSKQLTVCIRDESGKVVMRRQVSTRPESVRKFFQDLVERDSQFMAILEVCGFNDWLIDLLQQYDCREVVLIHPDKRSKKKTDRRDANKLCELLWLNGRRLVDGKKPQGIRRVYIPTSDEQQDRQLTAARQRIGRQKTRTLNKTQRILQRHNLRWDYPTKTFQTRRGRAWLKTVPLPAIDRLEMDQLLERWELWDRHIEQLDPQICERARRKEADQVMSRAELLGTTPGMNCYSGLALASRIGPVQRFPRPRSLSNYFGLTPGCRNSGNVTDRLGSITKEGSSMARFILGQLVMHVLKCDPQMRAWYRRIKRRRGSKIARVAVMRRLTTIFWHMLTYNEPYRPGGPPRLRLREAAAGEARADELIDLGSGSAKGGMSPAVANICTS